MSIRGIEFQQYSQLLELMYLTINMETGFIISAIKVDEVLLVLVMPLDRYLVKITRIYEHIGSQLLLNVM